jgi:microcystin-dependent protein
VGAQFSIPLIEVIPGQLIASALWNNEWNNLNTNFIPGGMDSYSDSDAQMQIQTAPYPGSVTSHASNLGGEIERIRYQIAAILGTTYWYQPPAASISTAVNSLVPLGGVIDYPSATAPNANYHLADGTAIDRVIYATLFALVGTTFGIGDGSLTFNLPNYTDKMSIAAGNLYALAATGGATTGTPTDAGHTHGDAHTHTMANHTHSTPNHNHDISHGTTTKTPTQAGSISPGNNFTAFTDTQMFSPPSSGSSLGVFVSGGSTPGNAPAWDNFKNTTEVSGAGTSGTPSSNSTDSQSNSLTNSGNANMNPMSILPPYIAMFKMIRVL